MKPRTLPEEIQTLKRMKQPTKPPPQQVCGYAIFYAKAAEMAMALPSLSPSCSRHCNCYAFLPSSFTCRNLCSVIKRSRNCGEFLGNSTSQLMQLWAPRRGGAGRMREGMSSMLRGRLSARASSTGGDSKEGDKRELLASEDMQYLGKLFAGCLGAAFVVKYGSLVVPTITVPNVNQALAMIVIPVAASIVLLAFASVFRSQSSK